MHGQRSFELAESSTSYNGRAGPAQTLWHPDTGTTADEQDLHRYSRGDEDDETTRYLAAAAQVNITYARSVRSRIIGERFRALAPVYGADLAVVARWALKSLRRRFYRDVGLAAVFVVGAAVFWLLHDRMPWHAWLLPFIVMLLVAIVGIVAWEEFLIRQTVIEHMLRGKFNPAGAPPARERLRGRLDAAAARRHGNLVVFQGRSAFVGSGRLEHKWNLVLDVSHGRESGKGVRQEPVKFTNAELHAALVCALNNMGLPYAHAEERLFVNGRYLQGNPGLLPGWDPRSAPPASVDDAVLRKAELDATPDARVYVCATMPGWRGRLVTTLFARAVHAGGSLYIEWRFHVLPPLSKLFPDVDSFYDEPVAEQLIKALGLGSLHAIPAFLMSPFALVSHAWRRLVMKQRRAFQAWKINRGQVFDYGAAQSIRETACGFTAQDYFLENDQAMAIMIAQETLIQAIGKFLAEHNIDLGEFENQVKVVTYSTQKNYNVRSYNIGDVSGAGIIFGDRSTVSDVTNVRASSGSAPEAKE